MDTFLTTDTLKVFPNQKLWWKCMLSAQSTGWCQQVGDRLAYSNDKRDLKSCADIFNIPLSSPHTLIDTCHHKAVINYVVHQRFVLTLIKACIPTDLNSYWFPSIALHATLFHLQHAKTHQNDICIFNTKDHSFF